MAHELATKINGDAAMAYVGETPWHGLGQALKAGASIETWREAAGMDFQIQRAFPRYATERDQAPSLWRQHREDVILFRNDTGASLGIVSPKFKIVQPGEILEFFRDLTESAGFELTTAGVLFDGRRFWALASIGESAVIAGEDRVGGYLLLSTACDGSLATTAQFTTVRVVCNNTLSMALNAKDKAAIKVTHRSVFDAASVKDQLGIGRGQFAKFINAAKQLAAKPVGVNDAEAFVEKLLKTVSTKDAGLERTTPYLRILDLFNTSAMGGRLVTAEGTQWGLLNAVTQYVDHEARAKSTQHRLSNAFWGAGDDLKTKAFEMLLNS